MPAHRLNVLICAVLLTLCSAFTAGYRTFVSLANYDDEGYMTWTVKNFLGGRSLYDQVATVYGPFYYLYEWCVLSLTGGAAGSDSLRLVAAAFWVAAALIAFLLIYRATGSLLLAVCVHLLTFRALGFIGEEPAHPQEACIFLLLALGRALYIGNPTLRMIMMGALGGIMAASKINLGVFVLVALTVGLAFAQPLGWRRTATSVAASLGALALPVVLMWDRRADAWAVSYCLLMLLSLASTLLTVRGMSWTGAFRPRHALLAAAAFALTAGAICCFPMARGSTLPKLFEWLIVMPRKWSESWALPANIHVAAVAWAAAGLVFAWYVAKRRVPDQWLALLKLAFATAVLVMCATNRYGGLLNFATPFLWLVAAPPAGSGATPRHTLARALLALLGVLQILYAYPVAGAQVGFVAVFMIVVAGICFWDGLSWLRSRYQAPLFRTPAWLPITLQVTVALLVAGLYLDFAWDARRTYRAFSPLNFPGAMHVRVEPDKAAALRAIVSRINSSCGTLVTEPGLFSFHLWTGKPSPPGLDHQVWMLLDDAAQTDIVRDIARDPRACVVYHQDVFDAWTRGANISGKPVVRFIRENFKPVLTAYGYCLMVRRPTTL